VKAGRESSISLRSAIDAVTLSSSSDGVANTEVSAATEASLPQEKITLITRYSNNKKHNSKSVQQDNVQANSESVQRRMWQKCLRMCSVCINYSTSGRKSACHWKWIQRHRFPITRRGNFSRSMPLLVFLAIFHCTSRLKYNVIFEFSASAIFLYRRGNCDARHRFRRSQ